MEVDYTKKIAVFTIDVEEWYHLEYFKDKKVNKKQTAIDGLTSFIRLIEENNIRATFFIVGELIDKIKHTLIDIEAKGNEIAIHSYCHRRPVNQKIKSFKDDVRKCQNELVKIFPNKLFGYRAPCFALDRKRLNELNKLDIKYDSSKINQSNHPLYVDLNINDFEKIVPNGIFVKNNFKVFEVSTVKIFGLQIPISGGGYLRIIPWFIYSALLKKYLKNNNFFNFYIHPFELSTNKFELPKGTSLFTRFRFNYNRKKVEKRISRIIKILKDYNFDFKTFDEL